MSGSKCFTVIVRGQEFKLSKGQIEFDTVPNLFSSCYLGPITLDRNPQLFAIIVEYLSGYDVLPLSERALPPTMDTKTALRNLLIDAEFYGLARLQRMLTMPSSPTIDMQWAGLSRQIVTLEDVLGDHLPPTVEYIEGGLYCHERGNPQPVIVCACDMPLRYVDPHSNVPYGC
ncbi:hypothetical protein JAAARDRAFT_455288 [Jaapia argillacea MUCL 33604]|uniref:BTB domain-containing protein n=1 Tax=Jaapia argillacea MUCL 33604 TaxID=933084 RepID=A0A067QI67_9AGAM|nr:hypothetical protein JAAARDRAFT_455288 [Jaapia argillacea MUCL 33604]